MGRLRSKIKDGRFRLRNWAEKRAIRTLSRLRHRALLGPDITRWLNRLLKANELTPEQRARLAHSGAWIVAPITAAQNLLGGIVPKKEVLQQRRARVFAETLSEIEPAILHRYWPGHPQDLERIRFLLGKMIGRSVTKVLPMGHEKVS